MRRVTRQAAVGLYSHGFGHRAPPERSTIRLECVPRGQVAH